MRNAFASEITSLAGENKNIVLLSADIGMHLFDEYKSRFPDRFFNCGVAEANMIGMAAGMALSGLHPVTYTITPFITIRCLEQIKIDVCYHNLPVIIVGMGSGLSYAEIASTHQSCDDITLLRVLPNMTVICPGDPLEVRLSLRAALEHKGPVYIRLGKKGEPVVHQQPPEFIIGKGIEISTGSDVCLLSTGNVLPIVKEASEELKRRGLSAQVVSFHTVKPLDEELLNKVFSRFKLVVTIEEHSLLGGFGGSIAEWLTGNGASRRAPLLRIGIPDTFIYEAGKQAYFRGKYGLTADGIVEKVLDKLRLVIK